MKSIIPSSTSEIISINCTVEDGHGRDAQSCRDNNFFGHPHDQSLFPGSLNLLSEFPVRFQNFHIHHGGQFARIIVPAKLEELDCIISHRFPLREPLKSRLLLFSEVKLRAHLALKNGQHVVIHIPKRYIGKASIIDRARQNGIQITRKLYQGLSWMNAIDWISDLRVNGTWEMHGSENPDSWSLINNKQIHRDPSTCGVKRTLGWILFTESNDLILVYPWISSAQISSGRLK